MKRNDDRQLAKIYKEIEENINYDIARKIYELYGGQQISFPKHFYNVQYLAKQIIIEYKAGTSIKELAQKYDYTERRVRQLVKEINE